MAQHLRPPARRWLFRGLAVVIGLLPLCLLEVVTRLAGWGLPPPNADPFVEFAAVRPLFELDAVSGRYVIPPTRQPYFKPDSFAATKGANEFRIFCFGGSTVQGNPYSIETAFSTWLELSLRAADPKRDWQVVNCGGISYASYRLEPIVRECLLYQPDLFTIYVGDNEFLEDRSFPSLRGSPEWVATLTRLAAQSRLFQVARQAWLRRSAQRAETRPTRLPVEVEARLDYQGGLEQYHRDESWRQSVADHFRFSLTSMVTHARNAGVPVWVIDPVSNVKDCPPFKVEPDPRQSKSDQQTVERLLAEADKLAGDTDRTLELLEEVRAIDGSHAGVLFRLGRAYLEAGSDSEARAALLRAKDEDVCPLRMTEPLRAILREVCRDHGVPVVPVFAEFCQRSPQGIPGDELLLDHVHPTISGHQLIADLMVEQFVQQRWLQPVTNWRERRRELYEAHLATLDAPYYARGQEHLEGLRKWAEGRVTKRRGPLPP